MLIERFRREKKNRYGFSKIILGFIFTTLSVSIVRFRLLRRAQIQTLCYDWLVQI